MKHFRSKFNKDILVTLTDIALILSNDFGEDYTGALALAKMEFDLNMKQLKEVFNKMVDFNYPDDYLDEIIDFPDEF